MAADSGHQCAQPTGSPFRGILIGSVLSLMLIGGVLFAYYYSRRPSPAAVSPEPEAIQAVLVEPVDRGNGVYYFPVTGEAYIASLVKFYEGNGKHCDLQGFTEKVVLYRQGWQSGTAHTEATGFILHCHDLAVNAQDVTVP